MQTEKNLVSDCSGSTVALMSQYLWSYNGYYIMSKLGDLLIVI